MAEVQLGQRRTSREHVCHISHYGCIEILQTFDSGHFIETACLTAIILLGIKQVTHGCKRGIRHRGRDYCLGDRSEHRPQTAVITFSIILCYYAGSAQYLIVIIIRQNTVLELHIRGCEWGYWRKITRLVFIRAGVGLVCLAGIIFGALPPDERSTTFEHIIGRTWIPFVIAINGLQRRTALEHIAHICHIGGIEFAYVQRGQRRTAPEHIAHIRHVGGIEMAEVQLGQRRTSREHVCHISHYGCIEILQTFDSGHFIETACLTAIILLGIKQVTHGCKRGIRHRGRDYCLGDRSEHRPQTAVITFSIILCYYAGSAQYLIVIIIRQNTVLELHIRGYEWGYWRKITRPVHIRTGVGLVCLAGIIFGALPPNEGSTIFEHIIRRTWIPFVIAINGLQTPTGAEHI